MTSTSCCHSFDSLHLFLLVLLHFALSAISDRCANSQSHKVKQQQIHINDSISPHPKRERKRKKKKEENKTKQNTNYIQLFDLFNTNPQILSSSSLYHCFYFYFPLIYFSISCFYISVCVFKKLGCLNLSVLQLLYWIEPNNKRKKKYQH